MRNTELRSASDLYGEYDLKVKIYQGGLIRIFSNHFVNMKTVMIMVHLEPESELGEYYLEVSFKQVS